MEKQIVHGMILEALTELGRTVGKSTKKELVSDLFEAFYEGRGERDDKVALFLQTSGWSSTETLAALLSVVAEITEGMIDKLRERPDAEPLPFETFESDVDLAVLAFYFSMRLEGRKPGTTWVAYPKNPKAH